MITSGLLATSSSGDFAQIQQCIAV